MRIQRTIITIFWAMFTSLMLKAQVFDIVVAKDGTGTVKTISAAINKIIDNNTTRTLIYIKNGTYNEKPNFLSTKTNVSLIGESVDGVIITYNDYSGKTASITTANSYTLAAAGNDFYAENLTIKNTSGNVGQAVAILTTGERQAFKNCKFYGFQDTYYAQKGRQYHLKCFVEGATDFIFGNSAAVFDNCTINCVSGGQFITAPSDAQLISYTSLGDTIYHGLLFNNCSITANSNVNAQSYYLGRTWAVPGSVIYKNCFLGNHINTPGWYNWNGTKGRYGEYKSKDANGTLVDVSGRASWSRQLTDDYATNYYNTDSFLCKSKVVWDPLPITQALSVPTGLQVSANIFTWTPLDQAKGYVIIRNDSAIGFSLLNSYKDSLANTHISNVYKVKSVSNNGNLSDPSNSLTVNAATSVGNLDGFPAYDIYICNKSLMISVVANIEIYSIRGELIKSENNTNNIPLDSFVPGIYLIKAINKEGVSLVKKIALCY